MNNRGHTLPTKARYSLHKINGLKIFENQRIKNIWKLTVVEYLKLTVKFSFQAEVNVRNA